MRAPWLRAAWHVARVLVGRCAHRGDRFERDDAGLWLVCDDCGRRVPAITRTTEERAAMVLRFPTPADRKARRHVG